MELSTPRRSSAKPSASDATWVVPTQEFISRLGEWWALHLDASAAAIESAGSIASEASKARDPFELWTMVPRFNASAASVFQQYIRRAMRIRAELRM